MTRVLIVDDDPVQLRLTSEVANRAGFAAVTASGGRQALELLRADPRIGVMVLDLVMPDLDGMAVLETMRRDGMSTPVIVQTAHSSLETVVSAMHQGAFDYFVKPVAPERLIVSLRNALKLAALETMVRTDRSRVAGTLGLADLVTRSPSMDRVLSLCAKAARSPLPILVEVYGADSPYTMVGEYAQVRSWTERAKPIKLAEAAKALDRIEPVFTKLFGASSQPAGAVLYSRARIAFARHDTRTTDALMPEAIAMIGDAQRADRAEGELFYATVLFSLGKRAEAVAMAEAAAKDYETAGRGYGNRVALARAWAAKPTATVPMPPAPMSATPAMPSRSGSACDKAGDVFLEIWPADERPLIEGWYRTRPAEGAQLLATIDTYVADWRAAARAACLVNNPQRRLCLDRARARATARIKNAANGTRSSIVGRASLPDFAHCATARETLPPDDDAYEALEKGERALEAARVMFEIKSWNAVWRQLSWTRDQLRIYPDKSLEERTRRLADQLEAADPRKKPGSRSGSGGP